jgi:phosphate transport system protein
LVIEGLLERMHADPSTIDRALELILVSKNIERIADHATNIAEDVIYLVEGEIIRHRMAARQ